MIVFPTDSVNAASVPLRTTGNPRPDRRDYQQHYEKKAGKIKRTGSINPVWLGESGLFPGRSRHPMVCWREVMETGRMQQGWDGDCRGNRTGAAGWQRSVTSLLRV